MTDATQSGGDVRLVITTCPDEATGEAIVRALVKERLAACGNIVTGVRSIFWWQGEVDTEVECLVLLKTQTSRLDQLAYLDWVVEETTSGS
jgi:periplasmic divalent cation tolerance protein